MKLSELKKVVKSAVKEAIQEEMKDILLEAVKSPTQPITSTPTKTEPLQETDRLKLRENMMNVLGGMKPGQETISMNSSHAQGFAAPAYNPGAGANTAGQGSSLPPGDVNLDQIMGLINKK